MKRVAALTIAILTVASMNTFAGNNGIDPVLKKVPFLSNVLKNQKAETVAVENANTVMVSFEIGEDGNAQNVVVEEGVSESLDQKAVETIENMPKDHLYEKGFFEGTRFVIPVKINVQ